MEDNPSCPHSGIGEHTSMYTKYTYVNNATKWLFYDFYFVSYMVCAYVRMGMCTDV